MKYQVKISYIFIIFVISWFIINGCSREKPVLKKNISDCTARDLLEYGRALFNADYYKEAIKEYRKVIALFPNSKEECSWAQYELAYSYYYMEDYDEALKEFKKIQMLYPDQRGPNLLAQKMITKISVIIY